MTGHGDDDVALAEQFDSVAVVENLRESRDLVLFGARSVHRHIPALAQLRDAAGVVGVMVGDDDCSQLQGPGIKGALHDGAVAWVNDDRLVSAPQGPDVIVDERRQRLNGDHVASSEEHTSELQSLMRISYAVL